MYPTRVSGIRAIRWAFGGSRFPAAQRIADTLVTLPTHEFVSEPDRQAISHCLSRQRAGMAS